MLAVTAFIIYVSKNSDGNKKIKKNLNNLKNLNNALMTKYLFNVANKDIRKTNLILNRFLACEIPFPFENKFQLTFFVPQKIFYQDLSYRKREINFRGW